MGSTRRIVRRLHLWLGLGLGTLMVLVGLTGSALVFYTEIDAWLHPEQAASGTATSASYDHAIATLRAAYPGNPGPWRLEVTGEAGAIPARYYDPHATAGGHFAPLMVWLSPDGAQILRRDRWGDYAMTWIYDLHFRLQLGQVGGTILGYAGLALFVLLLSGLWAWWPRGSWRKALRYKPGAAPSRKLRDVHKLAGLIGLPLLLLLTITGVMLALPEESDAVLTPVMGPASTLPKPRSKAESGPQIAPGMAVAAARRALPHARLTWIEIPVAGEGAFRLRMQQPGDPSRRFPHSFVWIDQHDGAVLAVLDAENASALSTVNNWLHSLHEGSVGGIVLRTLVLLAGLIPLVLFWSGLSRWLIRRYTDD